VSHEGTPLCGAERPVGVILAGGIGRRIGGVQDNERISVREAVEAIRPLLFEIDDPTVLFNVNAPEDLLGAATMLDRGYPKVKS
jgi:molybdopterin-guanine dinucleotide biosynthesis protein A